jgi:hypothetical protein
MEAGERRDEWEVRIMKGRHVLLSVFFLMGLAACESEFLDDFEDGIVNPAYHFIVGDPSSVVEGKVCEDRGCLWTTDNVYLFLPFIPGNPAWVRTPITPGVEIALEVLEVGGPSTVELGIANDVETIEDYFALKVEIGPTWGSTLTCYDETERLPLEGSLYFPMHLSIRVEDSGTISGVLGDGISGIECPLDSSIASETLAAAIVLWAGQEGGSAGVDNFHVKMD